MNIPLSPLQLLHYHFLGISVSALEPSAGALQTEFIYPKIGGADLDIQIVLGENNSEKEPNQFKITLEVSNASQNVSDALYAFSVKVEGFFKIDHDGEFEERKRLVVINGVGMLFGAIREELLSLTARYRNGPILLPSMDFRGLKQQSSQPALKPNPPKKASKTRSKKVAE